MNLTPCKTSLAPSLPVHPSQEGPGVCTAAEPWPHWDWEDMLGLLTLLTCCHGCAQILGRDRLGGWGQGFTCMEPGGTAGWEACCWGIGITLGQAGGRETAWSPHRKHRGAVCWERKQSFLQSQWHFLVKTVHKLCVWHCKVLTNVCACACVNKRAQSPLVRSFLYTVSVFYLTKSYQRWRHF